MSAAAKPREDAGVTSEVLSLADVPLSLGERAAIDVQIATAKAYPRNIEAALKEALSLATMDAEIAGTMYYDLPRGGKNDDGTEKTVDGPSVRLAEIMVYTWTNLRADSEILGEDKTHVTARATCFDLERNIAVRVTVKRSIVGKYGRYNADMIGVTSNAAIAIALRNAVFKVVPRIFTERVYQAARIASVKQAGPIVEQRTNAFAWFAKQGVTPAEVLAVLGVKDMDAVKEEQLIVLRGLLNAITQGETTIQQTFRPKRDTGGTADLNNALAGTPVAACEACGRTDGRHESACPFYVEPR